MNNVSFFQDWGDMFIASSQNLWLKVVAFLPEILSAIAILILGLIIAGIFAKIVKKSFDLLRIDHFLEKMKVKEELSQIGLKFNFSDLASKLIKWFFIIATWIVVFNVLNVPQITEFLETIALYIPNVLVAVIILAIGLILSNFISKLIINGLDAAKINKEAISLLSKIAKWAIIVFSLMAALTQLKVAADLISILFTGFVAALSLAGGLAFGLGGKEKARKLLEKLDSDNH